MMSTISGMDVDSSKVEPFWNRHEAEGWNVIQNEEIVSTVHASRPPQSELIHLRGVIRCTDIHINTLLCYLSGDWY